MTKPLTSQIRSYNLMLLLLSFFSFIFISWRLITLQYCSGFCHTLTWINHGVTCVPHPDSPSHLPLHPIPLGLPSAPAPSTVSCIQPGLVICFTIDNIHEKAPLLLFTEPFFLNLLKELFISSASTPSLSLFSFLCPFYLDFPPSLYY